MAMKLGGEYSAEKLAARHFERLAEEAGLGKALVKNRVMELANCVSQAATSMQTPHESIADMPDFIAKRCRMIKAQCENRIF